MNYFVIQPGLLGWMPMTCQISVSASERMHKGCVAQTIRPWEENLNKEKHLVSSIISDPHPLMSQQLLLNSPCEDEGLRGPGGHTESSAVLGPALLPCHHLAHRLNFPAGFGRWCPVTAEPGLLSRLCTSQSPASSRFPLPNHVQGRHAALCLHRCSLVFLAVPKEAQASKNFL